MIDFTECQIDKLSNIRRRGIYAFCGIKDM